MELVTIIGSDLFSQDEYVKQYLLDPDLPLIFKIKIGLRYYITADMILQFQVIKDHLGIPSFKDFKISEVRQVLIHQRWHEKTKPNKDWGICNKQLTNTPQQPLINT